MKTRVLCFLDNPLGRDTELMLPVTYCLERYLGAEVSFKFLWDMFYIKLWQPDVVLLPSIRGHPLYVEIAEYAKENGIVVLALESEGNFITAEHYKYWGYNEKKEIYQEWFTCWSQRTYDFLKPKLNPSDQAKLVVTGGTGFDRYHYETFSSKDELLEKEGLHKYSKVIGYAGWVFGKLYGAHLDISFRHLTPWKTREEALEWVEAQRVFVRDTLKTLIETNPDILFVLKKHPKENFESDPEEGPNEMNELTEYENVRYVHNEIPTSDLISACDVWMGFETTTALEGWMLNKPTILINKEVDFPRSSRYEGSLILEDSRQVQDALDEFYESGSIQAFRSQELEQARAAAISQSIGYADGLNHLRTYFYFRQSIPQSRSGKKPRLNLRHLRLYLLMHLGRFFYNKRLFSALPKFKKTVFVFENRAMPGLSQRKSTVYTLMDQFHSKLGITEAMQNDDWTKINLD